MLLLLLASCATLQVGQDRRNVDRIAARINAKDAAALAGMSRTPFLVDREIVLLPQDVQAFWQTALQAGFTVRAPRLREGSPVDGETWKRFADSMEVQAYFHKYLPKGTRLLEMQTEDGRTLLLLARRSPFSIRLYGLKGPYLGEGGP